MILEKTLGFGAQLLGKKPNEAKQDNGLVFGEVIAEKIEEKNLIMAEAETLAERVIKEVRLGKFNDDEVKPKDLVMEDISDVKSEDVVFDIDPEIKIKKASAEPLEKATLENAPSGGEAQVIVTPIINAEMSTDVKVESASATGVNGIDANKKPAFDAQYNAVSAAFGMRLQQMQSNNQSKGNATAIDAVAKADGKRSDKAMPLENVKQKVENPIINPKANPLSGGFEAMAPNKSNVVASNPLEFFKTLMNNVMGKKEQQQTAPVVAPSITANSSNFLQANAYVDQSKAVSSYISSDNWGQEVAQKVVWMVGGLEKSATLTLNPPEMGPLQVTINMDKDKADTSFVSNNPEVRMALEKNMDTLREMMRNSGIELGNADIHDGSKFSQNNQQQQSNRNTNSNSTIQGSVEAQPVKVSVKTEGIINTFA